MVCHLVDQDLQGVKQLYLLSYVHMHGDAILYHIMPVEDSIVHHVLARTCCCSLLSTGLAGLHPDITSKTLVVNI